MADILQSDPVHPSKEAVVAAALVVKAGGLAVLPTDTVYGLVADFKNPAAVERLYGLKGRPDVKGLPLLVGDRSQLDLLVAGVPDEISLLMDMYWPGPLTIVFNKKPEVPDLVTGRLPTVAVRQPGYVVAQAVLQEIGMPLASSSANLSGDRAPRSVAEMAAAVIEGADIVVDGGVCPRGIPSTILDVSGAEWRILRQGDITREAIETAVGRVIK